VRTQSMDDVDTVLRVCASALVPLPYLSPRSKLTRYLRSQTTEELRAVTSSCVNPPCSTSCSRVIVRNKDPSRAPTLRRDRPRRRSGPTETRWNQERRGRGRGGEGDVERRHCCALSWAGSNTLCHNKTGFAGARRGPKLSVCNTLIGLASVTPWRERARVRRTRRKNGRRTANATPRLPKRVASVRASRSLGHFGG
jgi:hypothetical protein